MYKFIKPKNADLPGCPNRNVGVHAPAGGPPSAFQEFGSFVMYFVGADVEYGVSSYGVYVRGAGYVRGPAMPNRLCSEP